MNESSIPIETLRSLLDYDRDTGNFTWRPRGVSPHYPETKYTRIFNKTFAGKNAAIGVCPNGYQKLTILNKKHSLHRVVWAYVYGEWPSDQIDHINGIKSDNRIANLRLASNLINSRNKPLPKNNKSGTFGVSQVRSGKWSARITVDGRVVCLGEFAEKSEAVSARKAGELKYGYHPNHGRAA